MAYRKKGAARRSYRSNSRSYSGRSRSTRAGARSGRVARRGRSGGNTVRLVIQHAPAQNGYMPGVPGTVGIAAAPPANPKARF